MPVTLTQVELSGALRLGDSAEEVAEATRLVSYATVAVSRHLGAAYDDAPVAIVNEAVIRLAAYLFDQPNAGRGLMHADALRSSGAAMILLPYKVIRAGSTGDAVAAAQAAMGSPGNPVTDVTVDATAGTITISFADGTTRTDDLPAGMGGGVLDQTARDSAAAAQTTADDAASAAGEAVARADTNATAIEANTTAIAAVPDPSGTKVYVQDTTPPASNVAVGSIWIADFTTSHPRFYEFQGGQWFLDYSFLGGRVHVATNAINIAQNTPAANAGDVVLELIGGTLKLYRRNSFPNPPITPYWNLIGTVAGGGGAIDLAALTPFVEEYALKGTSNKIDVGRLPDIPFSLLDGTLEPWTNQNSTAQIDDARLPPARLVPDPSSATDGQVAKVQGGAWTIGDDAEGTPGGGGAVAPLVKTTAEVTRLTYSESMVVVDFPTTPINVAVDTGIAVPVGTKTLLVNYGASSGDATAGIDLLWFPVPIEEWDRLVPVLAGAAPTHDNVRFTRTWRDTDITALGGTQARQVWLLKGVNGNVFVMTDNAGWDIHPFRVRFEIQETITVVADVTGNVDGGGGGALSVDAIAGLDEAPNSAAHSRAIFAGVFDSRLYKYEFGHLTALMRSTAGLGRQINPSGNSGNLGKVPVVHADGGDFHYLLQKPAELPTIASNAPTNPAHLNPAILYKDTPEGETANGIYYKRRHDRESVIIAINDTSPRSFGTEHRSFGWTNRIILDTAEPVPGVNPYPSAPPHWQAFIRVQNIASGLYEWRLYTDGSFTTETTIYLDMRNQDDPDTHIQNVAMTKPINEAYWSTGTYTFNNFPFYSIAGRAKRPVIRIRDADDTLSTSIIHLIPVDDVIEELVDEDRLHDVFADLLDILADRTGAAARWHFLAHANGPFTADVAKDATLQGFPRGGFASYAELYAAIIDDSITQIAVRISQNDVADGDQDYGTSILLNNSFFRVSDGVFEIFPGHALGVDPVQFTIRFGPDRVTVASDAAIPVSPLVQLRIAVWA